MTVSLELDQFDDTPIETLKVKYFSANFMIAACLGMKNEGKWDAQVINTLMAQRDIIATAIKRRQRKQAQVVALDAVKLIATKG